MTGILVAEEGRVGRITLNRPEVRNALDREMADALHDAIERLGRSPAVRVITIEGNGPDFCAGADLAALELLIDAPRDAHVQDATALGRVFLQLRAVPLPTVAIVRGRALAGGAGLASACDMILASDDASFGYPEVRVGFVPAMVMTMLRRAVGEKRAFDLVATGRQISATEAERIGLVSRVFDAAAFATEAAAVVDALSRTPATAISRTKTLLHELDALDFQAGIAAGIRVNADARSTPEFAEGLRKFLARNRPGQ